MSFISYPVKVDIEPTATPQNIISKPAVHIEQQVESGCFPRPHYTPRDIEKFNSLNMVQLLVWYDEASLVYDGKMLTLKEHPHCIVFAEGIYDTVTYRKYQVVDALVNLLGFKFPQACFISKNFLEEVSFRAIRAYCEHKYPNALKASLNNNYNFNDLLTQNLFEHENTQSLRIAYAVLNKRFGIDRAVITEFIYRRYLLMDEPQNLCFVTYSQKNIIAVARRMHEKNYNAEVYQSTKRNIGFQYASLEDAESDVYRNVYVFENVIDLMSYLSLVRLGKVPPIEKTSCLLTLHGLTNGAIYNFIGEHPEVKRIYGCMGNDMTAINAAHSIRQREYHDMQPILRDFSFDHVYVRNWNEMLKQIKNEHAA